jgi:hypothetical protein
MKELWDGQTVQLWKADGLALYKTRANVPGEKAWIYLVKFIDDQRPEILWSSLVDSPRRKRRLRFMAKV